MIVQTYGTGLRLETENDQFFFVRDTERSQDFKSKEESIYALKNRGIRWKKDKKTEEPCLLPV